MTQHNANKRFPIIEVLVALAILLIVLGMFAPLIARVDKNYAMIFQLIGMWAWLLSIVSLTALFAKWLFDFTRPTAILIAALLTIGLVWFIKL